MGAWHRSLRFFRHSAKRFMLEPLRSPAANLPTEAPELIPVRKFFRLAFGYWFDISMKPAKEDAARIWPWRDAKLT